ncbi:hypothetical protein RAZWK3B_05357 [Roseobacter sp. AzwK-3b]|jgi:hypothetical protein|uniref:Uncharacterized protein n=1 Tax=Roseovarius litoreus TaxID=1155722 RepID=A0A1M7A787_9RHOB|nr:MULTISPECIES: hypothetical protein [Roseobacteraceae]EDM70546.1 hypothetical protein RAZWK3B_05357 [Roseobacter sp. AzwK-3b]SHL38568.1 hypothetical protein SAMN05443432_101328 [Roseovarius litoreus]
MSTGQKNTARRRFWQLLDSEFVFARDMFFAPVNFLFAAVQDSVKRANSEARLAVAWSLSDEENGKKR